MRCWIDCTSGAKMNGARCTNETGEEERAACFHDDTAAGEDETTFGIHRDNMYRARQDHSHTDADGRTVDRCDGGLAAMVDCKRHTTTAIEGGDCEL